jgi:gliding motility-associated-like protein
MKLLKIILLLVFPTLLYSQNYVDNPSFERLNGCPDDFFQVYKAPPWFSPSCEPLRPDRHGYAILFTSRTPCFSDLTGVPKNVWCYQHAHTGFSYVGIEVVSAKVFGTPYRQFVETKLLQPLQAGKKYLFSMFYNLCYAEPVTPEIICFKTGSLGAHFSENIIDKNPNCQVLPVLPQVVDAGRQVSPSNDWLELKGCMTAKGNETYLTIGNFADNPSSNCSQVDSIGYYLFVDDVSVIPEIKKQIDTVVCNADEVTINAKQLRSEYTTMEGWAYKWNDGSGAMERKFTAAGNYSLYVSNADCFTDTFNFKIEFSDCSCKDYTPNTFTPNGDYLNDTFIPHIVCQTQQLSEYRFSVFDRWGRRIFFSTSQSQAWDGTYLGQIVNPGVYAYQVEYKARSSNELKRAKGTVLALR